jgi:hypothetical protein
MNQVKVVSVELQDDMYNVTLQRGNEIASCTGIMLWDDEILEMCDLFEEWVEYALEGEEGYATTIQR